MIFFATVSPVGLPYLEYGVAIAAIAVMFLTIKHLMTIQKESVTTLSTDYKESITKLGADHKSAIEKITNDQKEERKEWRVEAERREQHISGLLQQVIDTRGGTS